MTPPPAESVIVVTGLNFQLNRWLADVRPVFPSLRGYDAWRDTFIALGDCAQADGRALDAALHLRAAEFFMVPSDSRKTPTRRRLTAMLRGFDSYIEEFFPILLGLRDRGWTVVAFEGPGQGAVLEEQHVVHTAAATACRCSGSARARADACPLDRQPSRSGRCPAASRRGLGTRAGHARLMFTRDEAQGHCQVGNLPLAIATMYEWLEVLRLA